MTPQSKPKPRVVSSSPPDTSEPYLDSSGAQLSDPDGVQPDVSTAAFDRGMLMAASSPPVSAVFSAEPGTDQTDADVMLRVKAGDQSAFDYLVQKYRRAMVSFMYRMARNSSAAEDLAQEVFLR